MGERIPEAHELARVVSPSEEAGLQEIATNEPANQNEQHHHDQVWRPR
jgi:hypothetical protein